MSDWAAKVLAGVPRYVLNMLAINMEKNPHGAWVKLLDVEAAIAKLAEGDGLVERLNRADEYEPLGHDGWEAAARIAALTAQVAENRISEPHDPGDFVGDIYFGHPVKSTIGTHQWTGSEWVALPSEAEALAGLLAKARAEAAALRAKVALLEGQIKDWEARIDDCEWSANSSLTEGIRAEMRAALTDGAADA